MSYGEEFNQQLEELNFRIRALENENKFLKSGASTAVGSQSRANSPNREMSKLQEKITLLVAENERINHLLLEKSRNLEKMKTNLAKSQNDANFLTVDFEERTNRLADENKRLNKTVESWKKAAEDSQMKIQELQGSLTVFEDQKVKSQRLTQEAERLNQILKEKTAEVEKLQRDRELDRAQLVQQIGKMEQENDKLNHLLEEAMANLERSERLNQILKEKTAEIEMLQRDREFDRAQLEQQIGKMAQENDKLNHLLKDAIANLERSKNVVESLENTQIENKDLKEETLRLHEILEEKTTECEELRANYLELLHKREENEQNVQKLKKDNEEKTNRIAELSGNLESLRGKLLQEEAHYMKALEERDIQLVQARAHSSELEQIVARLQEEQEQIYQLLQSNSTLFKGIMHDSNLNSSDKISKSPENQFTNPFSNQQKKPAALKESILLVLEELNKFAQDNDRKMKEIDTYQKETAKVLTLTEKVKYLQQENENINKKLKEKQNEQEEKIKLKFMELQEKAGRVMKLEREIENSLQEKNELNATIETQRKENNSLLQRLNTLEQRVQMAEKLIENYEIETTKSQQKLQTIEEDRNQKIKQMQALEEELKQLREENVDLKELCESKSNDLQELGERMAILDETARQAVQLDKLNTKLKAENERLSDLAEHHEKEIENLKSNSGLIPQLQTRINQLAAQNAALNKEIAELLNDGERCKELEETVQKLQNKLKALTEENLTLEKKLETVMDKESQEFKSRLATTGLRRAAHSMTMSPVFVRSIESFGEIPEDFKVTLERLQAENLRLKEEIEKKDQQVAEYSKSYQSLGDLSPLAKSNEQIPDLENKIKSLLIEKKQLEDTLKKKEKELVRHRNLLKEIGVAIRQGENLESKLSLIEQESGQEISSPVLVSDSRAK